MRTRAVLLVAGVATAVLASAGPAPAVATSTFRLSDSRIDEASGIAAGIRSPGVVYVHNDSGDAARFFAVDAHTGATRAVYDVAGAAAVDWEDIAVAPDADGTPSVWLADTGDNAHRRSQIELYRVDEPRVPPGGDRTVTTARAQVWRLRYPSGPMDSESLAVAPDGVPYLVTKELDGRSTVYRAPARPSADVTTLRTVGAIRFAFTGTPGPFAPFGELAATGADLSRDGRLFVVRTYTDAYLWRVGSGGLAAALRAAPTRIALPRQRQGEGICFADGALLIDSEGRDSTVHRVAIPAALTRPTTRTSTNASNAPVTPQASPTAEQEQTATWSGGAVTLAVLAGLAAAGVGVSVLLRRRRA